MVSSRGARVPRDTPRQGERRATGTDARPRTRLASACGAGFAGASLFWQAPARAPKTAAAIPGAEGSKRAPSTRRRSSPGRRPTTPAPARSPVRGERRGPPGSTRGNGAHRCSSRGPQPSGRACSAGNGAARADRRPARHQRPGRWRLSPRCARRSLTRGPPARAATRSPPSPSPLGAWCGADSGPADRSACCGATAARPPSARHASASTPAPRATP